MKQTLIALLSTIAVTLPSQAASLAGLWEFNNPANLGQATTGPDLVIAGTAPSHSVSLADDAALAQAGVITTVVGPANNLVASNIIGGNGGGTFTNQYSLLIDMVSPVASRGTWRTLFQTAPANNNDGDYFINPGGSMGVGALTYSTAVNDTQWSRLVLTFELGTAVKAYLNGSLLVDHSPSTVDSRFSLGSTFLLFGDEDSENNPLNISTVALWSGALSAGEVGALGLPGAPVPEPTGLMLSLAALGGAALRRRR